MTPTLLTVRTAAIAIASFIFLGICSGLLSANVRRLASEKGWDSLFLKVWNSTPEWGRKLLSGWNPLRQLWWLWLIFGLSAGLGVALSLLPPLFPSMDATANAVKEAVAPVQTRLDEKTHEAEDLSAKLKHFSAPAPDDDIAKAIAPIRSEKDAALYNLKIATKQRDDLQKQYDALQQSPAQQNSGKVARYIKLKGLLKQAEEARSTLSTFDIHSAMKTWPTSQESLNQKLFYLRTIKPMTDAIQALKNVSNNAYGKTLDLDKSPSKTDNPIYKVPSEDDFHDPDVHMEYRRLCFTNENYKKEADFLISQLRLDFASITEAIANTPAGDSAIKD